MDTVSIIMELERLGVVATMDDEGLVLRPGSRIPKDLRPLIQRHKSEIVALLLTGKFKRTYPESNLSDGEIVELLRRVEQEGFVLCYAAVLEDFVAFAGEDLDTSQIPAGFVTYTESELVQLFGADKPVISLASILRIHAAKKHSARVISNEPEE